MRIAVIFSVSVAILGIFLLLQQVEPKDEIQTYLENSVPFVGTDTPRMDGIDGSGIRVAVIDTGVDFTHPDLLGWSGDSTDENNDDTNYKVVGGYNFVQTGQPPLDSNGHGTQVAGVIAADGVIKGIAPKAKILAYKVSEDGEGVSSELITRAIKKAINDSADIINISLGVNKTNTKIENAINLALEKEIFVVVAAGNDGPDQSTIGSPGRNFGSVTVGATYNNLTSSLVATLDVDEEQYTVIPMTGAPKLEEQISGKIVFANYGRDSDFKETDVNAAIVIVERGSDDKDEMLYFSIKEKNAADAGAKALIVYNNEPGIFLGELIHEFVEPGYKPRIPVVSMDREKGIEIRDSINGDSKASIHLFFNPDFVAHFSSRGPVSPFYIKPELVAPGAYINTTQSHGGYNFTSGTSYAAPHVSGAAALLMQKNPKLHHHEIKSLLLTTVEPVSDAYGKEFSIHETGAGRLDVRNAYNAKLVILPPNFVMNLSPDKPTAKQNFVLKPLEGTSVGNLDVMFKGPEFVKFEYHQSGDTLQITMSIKDEATQEFREYEGKILISHQETQYTIPFILHHTQGSVSATQQNQRLYFDIYHPQKWSFAKISVIDSKDGKIFITTATPDRDASIEIYKNSKYWIHAKIQTGGNTTKAFTIVNVESMLENPYRADLGDIPERQITIIAAAAIIIGIFGLVRKYWCPL